MPPEVDADGPSPAPRSRRVVDSRGRQSSDLRDLMTEETGTRRERDAPSGTDHDEAPRQAKREMARRDRTGAES